MLGYLWVALGAWGGKAARDEFVLSRLKLDAKHGSDVVIINGVVDAPFRQQQLRC